MVETVAKDSDKMKFDYKTYALYNIQERSLETTVFPDIVFRVPKVISNINDIHVISRDGRSIDTESITLMKTTVLRIISNDPSPIYNMTIGQSLAELRGEKSKTAIDPTTFYLREVDNYAFNTLSNTTIEISRYRDTMNDYHTRMV